MSVSWQIQGEFVASCNCEVFCPCVLSMGKARPTEGFCNGLMGVRIESGHYGDAALDDLCVCLLVDVPHTMRQGNWQAALYIDEKAGDEAAGVWRKYSGAWPAGRPGFSVF